MSQHHSAITEPNRFQRQRGFTLLEMMVAFVLISLLFLALFSSFNTMSRSWDSADARMLKSDDMRLIGDFLRHHLSEIIIVRIADKEKGQIYAFEGDEHHVRYAAPLQPLQSQGGIYLIDLMIKDERKGKRIEMRYAPYRPDLTWDDAFQDTEPVLVYEGLRDAKFSYFAAENIADEPEWKNEWKSEMAYPLLLKLSMSDAERPWPELITELPQVEEYAAQQ